MTMHKALYPENDVDKLYASRNEEKEDPPEFKTASMHRYNKKKIT